MDIVSAAAALEASALGQWMRGGGWSYAVVNVLHLLGLALLLGPILLLDLRLLGAGRRFDAREVSRALTPFAASGLALALLSGFALFSADASALVGNRVMQLKLLAVALALVNIALFHALWARHLPGWDRACPRLGRLSALMSILLWLSVPIAGRLIAYV